MFNISINYKVKPLFRTNIYFCYLNNNTTTLTFILRIFAADFSVYFLTSSSKFT